GDFRPEEPLLERPRQFSPAILEVFQVIAIRQQIKNKNFHEYVDTYRFDSIFTHVRVMGQCLVRVMGAAPPWGQSLLRSCLAAHSFPPPPPARWGFAGPILLGSQAIGPKGVPSAD